MFSGKVLLVSQAACDLERGSSNMKGFGSSHGLDACPAISARCEVLGTRPPSSLPAFMQSS